MAQLLVEYILGARRSYDGLIIDPAYPRHYQQLKSLENFEVAHMNALESIVLKVAKTK